MSNTPRIVYVDPAKLEDPEYLRWAEELELSREDAPSEEC